MNKKIILCIMSTHYNFVKGLNEVIEQVGSGNNPNIKLNIPNPFPITMEDTETVKGVLYDGTKVIQPFKLKHSFNLIGDSIWDIMNKVDNIHFYRICGYIAANIDFDSNWIKLSIERIKGCLGKEISNRDYYKAINILVANDIIRRTNIQRLYCVNPLYIYKGNLLKLNQRLTDELKNPFIIDEEVVIVDKYKVFKNKDDIKGTLYVDKSMYAKEVQEVEEIVEDDINYENNKDRNLKLHDKMVEEVKGKRSRRTKQTIISKNGIVLKI